MIIKGDSFIEIKKIKKSSIDLILTDPPYLISKKSNFKITNENTPEELAIKFNYSHDFGEWDKEEINWDFLFKEYYRVLKKGGSLIIFYDVWKSSELKKYAELNKFKQPRIGYWVKNNPLPINSKSNYLSNAIETFFTFVKSGKPTFNSKYDNGVYNYPICHGKERYKHPTQKPLQLIKDLIKKHSNEGDLVLDTFAGTGTTGEACKLLNREYLMIEKDEIYFNIMDNRLKNK
jgi:site-specific DNA-methyltransferase (adenine-specific)